MEQIFRETKSEICFSFGNAIDFPAHIHDDIELIYVKSGNGTAICDGEEYLLGANSFFIAFPNQVHSYNGFSFNGEYYVIILKPNYLLNYSDVFSSGIPTSAICEAESNTKLEIANIISTAYFEQQNACGDDIIRAYMTLIFGKLLSLYRIEKNAFSKSSVLAILQYCSAHYRQNITVSDIAAALHISKSHISHIFSEKIRMNFCDYINSLRLSDAVNMLEGGTESMTSIAELSGFSTIRSFNRAFLNKYGISPSEYRKQKIKR